MSRIILPPSVAWNLERERMAERHGALKWFDVQLKELDLHADLVKASEHAEAPGMVPGYWHVRRTDPVTGWTTYIALKGPDGGFSEPHSGHLERLREFDLQRPGGWEDAQKRIDREEQDRERMVQDARADFKEEFMARYLNKSRPSISFNVGEGWRNRVR